MLLSCIRHNLLDKVEYKLRQNKNMEFFANKNNVKVSGNMDV